MNPHAWSVFSVCAATCAAGCLLALYGEWADKWYAALSGKLVAATAYIAAALSLGAGYSPYGKLLLGGMLFCWLGDLLLVSKHNRSLFTAGLFAFLAGHVFYAFAFVQRGVSNQVLWWSSALMVVFAWAVLRWLGPRVAESLRVPVGLYVLMISGMMALALATHGAVGSWAIVLGAALFVASDLFVARNRFVVPGVINRVIGLPLYFIAQLLLALSSAR